MLVHAHLSASNSTNTRRPPLGTVTALDRPAASVKLLDVVLIVDVILAAPSVIAPASMLPTGMLRLPLPAKCRVRIIPQGRV